MAVRVLGIMPPRDEDIRVGGGAGGLSGGDWNMEQLRASHGGTTTTTRSKKNTVTFMSLPAVFEFDYLSLFLFYVFYFDNFKSKEMMIKS